MKWNANLLGTTSGRASKTLTNSKIFVSGLNDFWKESGLTLWNESTQASFHDFCMDRKIINSKVISETKKAKNARQKTSNIEQLGLVDKDRKITKLGNILISNNKAKLDEFPSISVEQSALLFSLLNHKVNGNYIQRNFIEEISETGSISSEIYALKYLISNNLTKEELAELVTKNLPIKNFEDFHNLIHHQNGEEFNKFYYDVFKKITTENLEPREVLQFIKQKKTMFFRELATELFDNVKIKKNSEIKYKVDTDEKSIAIIFLEMKKKVLIKEYIDQFRRNAEATGLFSYFNGFFFIDKNFSQLINKFKINKINDIYSFDDIFMNSINEFKFNGQKAIKEYVLEERSMSFEKFLDNDLTIEVLISFLENMCKKDYSKIDSFFSFSSNNHTYAEFLVAVAFHYLTGRSNNFISSWNGSLSLDNNPLNHAPGGVPDSAFDFQEQTIVVETTIQTSLQQTTNEISPISKHLREQKTANPKFAILFALKIFSETEIQMEIQRNSGYIMFPSTFEFILSYIKINRSIDLEVFKNV